MCGVCGCSESSEVMMAHQHDDELIHVEQNLMAKNDGYAHQNQHYFDENQILAFNIMSSPGSGKTTLLSRTMANLRPDFDSAVIVGDQQTDADANMIKASGGKALQINTGKVCHLDAHMLGHAVQSLKPAQNSLLFIENIGNLVCPALFSLGEHRRVVILSVTEGENKPLKYPDMFHIADLVLITKTDLLPYLDFDMKQCQTYIHQTQPKAKIISVSAKTGEGLGEWYAWLNSVVKSRDNSEN